MAAGHDQSVRLGFVTESHNVVDMATKLADAMSADLGDIRPHDVLDWLASAGLTLRPDDGDTTVAYQLLLEEGLDEE